jgi:hypothetical protein
VIAKAAISQLLVLMIALTAAAQHGKSEKGGLYNFPYKGDTWTGEIISFGHGEAARGTVTLSYTDKKGQVQTLEGRFTSSLKMSIKDHPEQKIPQLRVGDRIIAYYIAPGQKYFVLDQNGKRKDVVATENIIFEVEVLPKKN